MTEELTALLNRTADAWCRGAEAPPPPLPTVQHRRWRGTPRTSQATRRLAPVLVAAAVVAVVVPTFMLLGHPSDTGRPLRQVGGPVDVDPAVAVQLRPDDAGLPASSHALPDDPNLPACEASRLTASLDLTAGHVLIEPLSPYVCRLPAGLHVELPAGIAVKEEVQPDVPNPPAFGGRFLESGGVALNTSWTGSCDALLTGGTVVGDDLRVPMTVTGTRQSCGTGDAELRVGPAHAARAPGAVVPSDRARLVVTLQPPQEAPSGGAFTYQVELANPTSSGISLRPCPTFSTFVEGSFGGSGGPGRLPCDSMPDTLASGTKVVLVMHGETMTAEPTKSEVRKTGTIKWGIAGTAEASAPITFVQRAPEPLTPIPYLAPSGTQPSKSSFRYRSGGGVFPIVIDGPATVRAGETLHYRAVFTNPAGGPVVPLDPCPAWTETMAQAPKVTNKPKVVERTGSVNCAHAPAEVGPGQQIAFEMERVIGPDTPPGAYQIYWQIHNGLVSAPFDLEVVP